jgi:hypothetical protein
MAAASKQEMEELDAVLAEAERLIAEHDNRIAIALIKGQDTIHLEDRAQHMRTSLARLKLQRRELTQNASGAIDNKAA